MPSSYPVSRVPGGIDEVDDILQRTRIDTEVSRAVLAVFFLLRCTYTRRIGCSCRLGT